MAAGAHLTDPTLDAGGVSAAAEHASVRVRDAWFAYRGRPPVLRGTNLEARAGEITVVLGGSGGGKTTLLRVIKGLLRPQQGEVLVCGDRPRAGGRLDARVAYIPQQLGLVRSRSVLDNVLMGALARTSLWRSLLGAFPAAEVARAREAVASVGLLHKLDEPVHSLSGGERQRVAIARSLAQRAQVILADEFVSQLDVVTSGEVMALMRDVARSGVAVVMTTHELDLALGYADRLVVLNQGVTVLDSAPAELDDAALARAIRT